MNVICFIMTTITFYNFSKNKNLLRYQKYKHNTYDTYDKYDTYDDYDNYDNYDDFDDISETYSDDIYETLIKNKFY